MKKNTRITTLRRVTLARRTALSVGLHYLESRIPPFVPVPGFRLGLANIVSLFVLYYYGGASYLFVRAVKTLIVALISTGFNVAFFRSLSGTILAVIVSLLLYYLIKPSIYIVSLFGSLFHTIGQLLAYAIFFSTPYIFYYIIILGPISLVTGILRAVINRLLLKKIPRSIRLSETKRRS